MAGLEIFSRLDRMTDEENENSLYFSKPLCTVLIGKDPVWTKFCSDTKRMNFASAKR
jgi:hypothetical protein